MKEWDRDEFEKVRDLTIEAGLSVANAEYSDDLAGSWWVVVHLNDSYLRIVWNNRDRWAVVQNMTNEIFGGQAVWNDIRTIKRRQDFLPERVFFIFKNIYNEYSV